MTGWTLFFVILGVAFLTAQLFRLMDFIEGPARGRTEACRRNLPAAWNVRLWRALNERRWTSWKS